MERQRRRSKVARPSLLRLCDRPLTANGDGCCEDDSEAVSLGRQAEIGDDERAGQSAALPLVYRVLSWTSLALRILQLAVAVVLAIGRLAGIAELRWVAAGANFAVAICYLGVLMWIPIARCGSKIETEDAACQRLQNAAYAGLFAGCALSVICTF